MVLPRTLSKQEARVVLTLEENHQMTVTRQEIISLLKASKKAADHVIQALRIKGWLERIAWGKYELIPCNTSAGYSWSLDDLRR